MLQTITNPYTIEKLNRNLAFYVTYKYNYNGKYGPIPNSENNLVDLSDYCQNYVTKYGSVQEIPEANTVYLKSNLKASNIKSMFSLCEKLETIPDFNIDVTNCTDYSDLFYSCSKLKQYPSKILNNYNVENADGMFASNLSMTTIPLDLTKLTKCTRMKDAFESCKFTIAPELPPNVNNIRGTFNNCDNLIKAPKIPDSVENMYETFFDCNSLETAPDIPINVTNINKCFGNCTNLKGNIYIYSKNITNATEFVTNEEYPKNIYCYANSNTYNSLTSSIKSYWNATIKTFNTISSISEITEQISNIESQEYIPDNLTLSKGGIDTINIEDWAHAFEGFKSLISLPDKWYNMKNAINCESLLEEANSLLDASVIEFGDKVNNLNRAFYANRSLTKIPVLPKSVETLNYTFSNCDSLVELPILPESVKELNYTFEGMMSLQEIDYIIPKNVETMIGTFANANWVIGNIHIESEKITDCTDCFKNHEDNINIYVKENSITYDTFKKEIDSNNWNVTLYTY